MSRIRIKNFGPIKEGFVDETDNDWMDIKKITVFIGNQGSGKSTIAKLISTLTWIEKALVRGDYPEKEFTNHSRFIKKYCSYHRLENYFKGLDGVDRTVIEYEGIAYSLTYKNKKFTVEQNANGQYLLPQVMYVPAERNFISTINRARMIKLSSGPLVEFLTEFDNAKNEIKESITLPINKTKIEYDRLNDIVNIKGDDYKVKLTEASSGFQSSVPLFLVSRYIAHTIKKQTEKSQNEMSSDELNRFRSGIESIWADKNLTEEQRRVALSALSSRFKKSAFINIVEEPEQNLYPSSQRQMLNSLLEYAKLNEGNELVITTHSPYIINYLTLAIKASMVLEKIGRPATLELEELKSKLNTIVPTISCVSPVSAVVYELTENGKIIKLPTYEGLPSDSNFLNQMLAEDNRAFDSLLEIEEEL